MLSAELNRTRKLGVEYEMTIPLVGRGSGHDVQQTLADILSANGLRAVARGYSHDPLPSSADFAVEHDGSVRGESEYAGIQWYPIELKTRILTYDEWENLVPKALDICRYMGARVNKSCGHHVHLALDEVHARRPGPKVIRSLFNIVRRFEPVLFSLVAPSRRTSQFTRPLPDRTRLFHDCHGVRGFRQAVSRWERYYGLNLVNALASEPHVEFRYHHGTLEVEKARHWLRLCLQIVQHATVRNCAAAEHQTTNDRNGFENLRYALGLKSNVGIYSKVSDELKETGKYFLKRFKHFNEEPALTSGEDDKSPQYEPPYGMARGEE